MNAKNSNPPPTGPRPPAPPRPPQSGTEELESLRQRIARIGLDVDRALRGEVNEQSPLGTGRLRAIAASSKPTEAQAGAVPLTRDRVKAILVEAGYDGAAAQHRADFINGLRHGEAAHGIKGGQHG